MSSKDLLKTIVNHRLAKDYDYLIEPFAEGASDAARTCNVSAFCAQLLLLDDELEAMIEEVSGGTVLDDKGLPRFRRKDAEQLSETCHNLVDALVGEMATCNCKKD